MAIKKWRNKTKGWAYKALVMAPGGRWMRSHTWQRKLDAEREERELLTLRDKGAGADAFAPMPFPEAAEKWLEDCERRVSSGHRQRVEQYVRNHFGPYFGERDIKRIRPSDIAGFVAALRKKDLSPETVNSCVSALKAMFNFHVEDDAIASNPVRRKHRVKTIAKENVVWTREEAEGFLAYAERKYRGEDRWTYLFYKIALNSGARMGEIFVLERADFEFDKGRICISKSYCRRAGTVKAPKNGSKRYAPLSPKLVAEVRRYVIEQGIFGPLFVNGKGGYHSEHTLRHRYYRDIEESGMRRTKFHNTRRFFVTHYGEQGGTEAQLRKIVGHASREMTDLYTAQREEMHSLAKIVNI